VNITRKTLLPVNRQDELIVAIAPNLTISQPTEPEYIRPGNLTVSALPVLRSLQLAYDFQSICAGFPLVGSYSKMSPLFKDFPVNAKMNAQ